MLEIKIRRVAMLEQAKKLLKEEYKKCLSVVNSNAYYVNYANEKWQHSWQVLGAGNYVMKHEPWFNEQNAELIEKARTALLLHDVARFEEITQSFLYKNKIDHGERGCQKLREMPEYDDLLVAFPIKHHGHLKESFYKDPEFLSINDEKLRDEAEHIFWLVRDADKIANFNIICCEQEKYLSLFLPSSDKMKNMKLVATPGIVDDFCQCVTVRHNIRETAADYCLAFISWFFDIKYKTSVIFCKKLGLVDKMFDILRRYSSDEKLNSMLRKKIEDYLGKNFS